MVVSTGTAFAEPRSIERRGEGSARQDVGEVLSESAFLRQLRIERRRTERSGKPFMLMLLSGWEMRQSNKLAKENILGTALGSAVRETDIVGWHKKNEAIGVLLTDLSDSDGWCGEAIAQRLTTALVEAIGSERLSRLRISVHLYPQPAGVDGEAGSEKAVYRDLLKATLRQKIDRMLKRFIDIAGSVAALMFFAPVFLVIAILIKRTSEGPVFYSQKRVGRYGRLFNFYKFRSMYENCESRSHETYVTKLIAGSEDTRQANGSYKLVDDPRITPLGRILRKTSLDEIPQFVNVLRGDMSLVGPRPPLPYECACYKLWHKRRVMEIQPGLTGLWQITGRSRTTFNEMVRMDIKYAKSRTILNDINIIVQTPKAMFSGQGAC